MQRLRIVAESEAWVVVDKPAGFHTHPPEDKALRILPRWNALGILQKQIGQPLYPSHRLDRATSGLLLYSKDRQWNASLQEQFAHGQVKKRYFLVARGEIRESWLIEDALESERGALLPASTFVEPAFSFELPIPHPRGGHRKFTVASANPAMGRFHQIRRHLAGKGFPLVGDSRHGDKKLNRLFAEHTGCNALFLRCMELAFRCPQSGKIVQLRARWSREWHKLFDVAGACSLVTTASAFPEPRSPF